MLFARVTEALREDILMHGDPSFAVRGVIILGLHRLGGDVQQHRGEIHKVLESDTISDALRRELTALAQTPQPQQALPSPPASDDDDDDFWDVGISV
jgi:hypothetical protein